jgi:hypothetical protein
MNYMAVAPPPHPKPWTHRNISMQMVAPVVEQPKAYVPADYCGFIRFQFHGFSGRGCRQYWTASPVHDAYRIFEGNVQPYRWFNSVSTRDIDSVLSRRDHNPKQHTLHALPLPVCTHETNRVRTSERIFIFHIGELKTGDTLRLEQDKYNGRFIRSPTLIFVRHLEHSAVSIYWSEKRFREN